MEKQLVERFNAGVKDQTLFNFSFTADDVKESVDPEIEHQALPELQKFHQVMVNPPVLEWSEIFNAKDLKSAFWGPVVKVYGKMWRTMVMFGQDSSLTPPDAPEWGLERIEDESLLYWWPELQWKYLWQNHANFAHNGEKAADYCRSEMIYQARLNLRACLIAFGCDEKELLGEADLMYVKPVVAPELSPKGVSSADIERSAWVKNHGSKLGHGVARF